MMNSQELETAVRLKLHFVVIILNDSAYGMIKYKQVLFSSFFVSFSLFLVLKFFWFFLLRLVLGFLNSDWIMAIRTL